VKNKLAWLLFVLGLAVLILSVYGNFLWVEYFSAQRSNTNKPFEEMALDALPFFLIAVTVGIASWFLDIGGKKNYRHKNHKNKNNDDSPS